MSRVFIQGDNFEILDAGSMAKKSQIVVDKAKEEIISNQLGEEGLEGSTEFVTEDELLDDAYKNGLVGEILNTALNSIQQQTQKSLTDPDVQEEILEALREVGISV